MRSLQISSIWLVLMGATCDGQPVANLEPDSIASLTPIVGDASPAPIVFDTPNEDDEASDCRRWLNRSDGSRVCLDVLLQEILGELPRDNDGDGIPNISDDDIDGDGIPNGYDLDTDGDGLPNSSDDDIDDDGVSNDEDVDIDGDFLRNRWDPDIDGDLIYNPRDSDADGDGRFKAPPIVNFACGPVDLFNDPGACGAPSDDDCEPASSSGGSASGAASTSETAGSTDSSEKDCEDKGNSANANPGELGRNATLSEIIAPEGVIADDPQVSSISLTELPTLEDVLAPLIPDAQETFDELREVDEELNETDYADALTQIFENAIDPEAENGNGGLSQGLGDAEVMTFIQRQEATIRLAQLPDVNVSEGVDITGRFGAAVNALSASLAQLVDTTIEIDANFLDTSVRDDAAMAVSFVAAADEAELDVAEVPGAIPSTARTLNVIGNQATAEAVWQIVVDQVAGYQNEDDSFAFSLIDVARLVEDVAGVLDDPNIEAVGDSVGAVLEATTTNDLSDPRAVFQQLLETAANDPTVSVADGISAAEATAAAETVANK